VLVVILALSTPEVGRAMEDLAVYEDWNAIWQVRRERFS